MKATSMTYGKRTAAAPDNPQTSSADDHSNTDTDDRETARPASALWTVHGRRLLGTFAVITAAVLWQVLADKQVLNQAFTSSPSNIYHSAIEYLGPHGTGWGDLAASGQEFAWGFLLAIGVGLPLGILAGWHGFLDALMNPFVVFFNNSPRIAFAPLFVIWFGLGITSKIAVVFLSAVLPIMISARGGVKTVDSSLVSMARAYGASDFHILRTVVLPGTVPSISSGIRISIGQALLGVVLAEYIASTKGLGYALVSAAGTFNTDRLFVVVIVIALLGVVASTLLGIVERYFERWRT
jgi:ABC-type nitrate/sulfonate/bicarbonate transport system permease component